MPSDFATGRPPMPKTLADLIRQLSTVPAGKRSSFSSSPVLEAERMKSNRRGSNRETEQDRRSKVASEALKALRKR